MIDSLNVLEFPTAEDLQEIQREISKLEDTYPALAARFTELGWFDIAESMPADFD